jgi:hypothetical protein
MATLKEIKGTAIQFLDEDPVVYVGSWSSGGALNTARSNLAGAGTQTASIMFGGSSPAPSPYPQPYYIHNETESYDGTTFTEVANLNTARITNRGGFGTSTAGFLAGGYTYPPAGPTGIQQLCESWNGSAWSETTDFNTKRYSFASSSSSPYTSAIITGGFTGGPPPSQINNAVETWNGSSWTETTETNSTKGGGSGAGTSSTAAIVVGPTDSSVESWDGSSWTEVAEMTTTRSSTGSAGTYTSALWFGGPSSSAKTESWNGTSWTELNDLSTGRGDVGSAGGSNATTSAFAAGGTPPVTSASEEWSFPPSTSTTLQEGDMWFNSSSSVLKGYGTAAGIPAATWSSGGSLNTARYDISGLGLQDAALATGGYTGSDSGATEIYNGSSWTEVNDLNTSRRIFHNGFGTTTAGLVFAGYLTSTAASVSVTESWNGTNWTEVNDMNTARNPAAATNTSPQSDGLCAGGNGTANVESWDGNSWTEGTNLNTSRTGTTGAGISSTSAISFSNLPNSAITEVWNGTSWTEVSDLNTGRNYGTGTGSASLALMIGGRVEPNTVQTKVEAWDGSSWTEVGDIATATLQQGAAGPALQALTFGGETTTYSAATEEWTVDATVSTVTTS